MDLPNLSFVETTRKTGQEQFINNGNPTEITLLNFWQWNNSDLINNVARGRLAEFIVASAIGKAAGLRTEWDAYDLETSEGIKIEVKSAAYIQSWQQKNLSKIAFDIHTTRAWDSYIGKYNIESKRQADVYVFCLLHHSNQTTLNPLDLSQWEFYVCPTSLLNSVCGNRKSISLKQLKSITMPVLFDGIMDRINAL